MPLPDARFSLGDKVNAEMAAPPWTGRIITLTIDGARIATEYEETWADDEGPSRLAATVREWEYHLIVPSHDRHGNETANDWGWLAESKLEPA